MSLRKKLSLFVLLLLAGIFGYLVFSYRQPLLERYYLYRLTSALGEDRWGFAAKLEAIGSQRVQDWYLSQLTEEPDWEGRTRAAERLADLRAERAISALLKLQHPKNSKLSSSLSGQKRSRFIHVYDLVDLVPRALTDAGRFDAALARYLNEDVLRSRAEIAMEITKPGKLFSSAPLDLHGRLSLALEARRMIRKVFLQFGESALGKLDSLASDPATSPALQELAALEAAILRAPPGVSNPPKPTPVPSPVVPTIVR